MYAFRNRYTKSFLLTLVILPAIVSVVIMMVNGNVGAGVAVMGAFSLVRFRSVPGSAKEIAMLFLSMGAGLATGMGYLGYAVVFSVILGLIFTIINCSPFGESDMDRARDLRITIPEDLNYTEVFEDIFEHYTASHALRRVKTTNMGSLFKLEYDVTLRDPQKEKDMIDALRVRNGNLEISAARPVMGGNEL